MTEKEIIENAPDGWTGISYHIVKTFLNIKNNKSLWWDGEQWHKLNHPLKNIRSRADIERIAELEKQLKPNLFWDSCNTETSYDNIEELMHIKFEDGAEVGDEVEIQRAALLTNETYVFTKIDDDDYSCEYKLKGGDYD